MTTRTLARRKGTCEYGVPVVFWGVVLIDRSTVAGTCPEKGASNAENDESDDIRLQSPCVATMESRVASKRPSSAPRGFADACLRSPISYQPSTGQSHLPTVTESYRKWRCHCPTNTTPSRRSDSPIAMESSHGGCLRILVLGICEPHADLHSAAGVVMRTVRQRPRPDTS
jgi:hypothetical protein